MQKQQRCQHNCLHLLHRYFKFRFPVRLQVVQEIKVLRSNISAREREKAERATLVQQDKLIKAKVSRGLLSCQLGAAMPGKLTCLGCTWGAEPVAAGTGSVASHASSIGMDSCHTCHLHCKDVQLPEQCHP